MRLNLSDADRVVVSDSLGQPEEPAGLTVELCQFLSMVMGMVMMRVCFQLQCIHIAS